VDAAAEHGVAIRVLEAETGHGKTYVAQSLFDQLADRSAPCYWKRGLAPIWPPTIPSELEVKRKTVVPSEEFRTNEPGSNKRLGFVWIGLPLGERHGAGQVNNITQILEQLVTIYHGLVTMRPDREKSERLATAARETALQVLQFAAGFVLPGFLTEVLSGGQSIKELAETWQKGLVDPTEERRREVRDGLLAVLADIRRLVPDEKVPLVIVLDDAHAALPWVLELVGLLTGLPVDSDEIDDDAINDIDPIDESEQDVTSSGDWTPPEHGFPTLVVATTWPGEARRTTDGGFDKWVATASQRLANRQRAVETISIGPINPDAGIRFLTGSGLSDESAREMFAHCGKAYDGNAVNALVLANARANVEQYLGGGLFTPKLDSSVIAGLPTAPTFHTQRRLDELSQEGGDSQNARYLLNQLAEWGAQVPMSLVTALKEQQDFDSERLLEILKNHRMINLPASEDRPQLLGIQVDLQRYIADTNKNEAPVRLAARKARNLVLQELQNEYDTDHPLPSLPLVKLIVRRAADLDTEPHIQGTEYDAMAWTLGGPPWEPNPSADIEKDMLRAVATSGKSRVAAMAARELASRLSDTVEKIHILRDHAERNANAAIELARLLPKSEAIGVLRPFAERYAEAAVALARLLDRTEAIAVLRPFAERDANAAMVLARLLPKSEAIAVLRPFAERYAEAAVALARLLDRTEAIAVLRLQAEREANVAGVLARLLPKSEAIAVLRPHAERYANAAIALARLLPKSEAIGVLRPHAERDANAAVALARLLPVSEAIAVLRPHAERNANPAMALARLLPVSEAIAVLRPHAERHAPAAIALARLLPDSKKYRILNRHRHYWEAAVELARWVRHLREKTEILRKHAVRRSEAAIALASLLPVSEAIAVLQPHAERDANAAVELAKWYPDPADKIRTLRPHAERDSNAAVALARLLDRTEAIAVLQPHAERYANAAVALASLLDRTEAIAVLQPLAEHYANAAVALARLLDRTEAIAVLRPHAERYANAAVALADLHPERREKIRIFRPLAERDADAAVALASLLDRTEAIAVLRPYAERDADARRALAKLVPES